MEARIRSPRSGGARPSGQHFIRSDAVAAELVRDADIRPADHVLEIGAGGGRLTRPLAERAGRVTAIELDPTFVALLRAAFAKSPNVLVVSGDVLQAPLPEGPWRAFGNVPFALTTPILRRLLDDTRCELQRADLLIQFEAARKRASVDHGTLLSLGWLPWWELSLTRRVSRRAFDPPPSVDAGMLSVVRRPDPLLGLASRPAYGAMLASAFNHGSWPVRRSLAATLSPRTWKRLARDRGLQGDARPSTLDVWDWLAVFAAGVGGQGWG